MCVVTVFYKEGSTAHKQDIYRSSLTLTVLSVGDNWNSMYQTRLPICDIGKSRLMESERPQNLVMESDPGTSRYYCIS